MWVIKVLTLVNGSILVKTQTETQGKCLLSHKFNIYKYSTLPFFIHRGSVIS